MTTDPEARQTALAKIDAKSRRTAPFGYEYRGEWVSPADGVPHPCLCEEVKLDAVEADARDLVAEQILERAKRLAGRDWRHVVPPLQVETAQGDVRAISLAQGSRLADFVNEHNGHPDARARLADWFEQLLGGLAELHAADLTLGPFELPDVLTSGDDAGSPETLRWLHAATLPVEAWSAGTALRRDERTLSAACQNGGMRQRLSAKQQDLRRLGLLTCCLAGGRQAVADADAKGRIKAIGGRRLRWFVRDLLQNEDGESHGSWLSQAGGFVTGLITPRGATSHVDAIGALQDWRKASTSQKPWWTAAFVALILLAALAVWGRRGSRTSNGLQRQLTTTMQQRDDAEAKLGQRTLELEECTRNLVECTRGSERESLADDGVDEERVTHFAASLLRNLLEDIALSAQFRDQDVLLVADCFRLDVLVAAGDLLHRIHVHSAFV